MGDKLGLRIMLKVCSVRTALFPKIQKIVHSLKVHQVSVYITEEVIKQVSPTTHQYVH